MDKATHKVRLSQWASLIQECNSSGMTKRDWLIENNIDEKRFYYWQRKVRTAVLDEAQPIPNPPLPAQAASAIVTPSIQALPQVPSNPFVELSIPAENPHSEANISATLRYGQFTLELNNSISNSLLEMIVQVISHA